MKIKIKFLSCMTAILIAVQSVSVSALALTSGGACAINADSGAPLFEYNADTPLVPASMTKLMTLYITFDKMALGLFSKDTPVVCTSSAARLSRTPGASNIPLSEGVSYTVDELISAAVVPSACSAAMLLGEFISGSESEFVKLMNNYVYILGLEAYYADSSGLSDNNRITPRSMVQLGARFINDYPDILNYTSAPSVTIRGVSYSNTNSLLPGKVYAYPGTDGLKTGTSSLAGRCITATAKRDGIRVVAVTMHSGAGSARYSDIRAILDESFEKAAANVPKIIPDSTRIFINGEEIPSLYATDNAGDAVILAEQLAGYGFTVTYSGENRTVLIEKSTTPVISPVNCTEFETFSAASVPGSDLKVVLSDGNTVRTVNRVYDLSGYAAIPISELENLFAYSWNQAEMSGYFTIDF